MDCQETDLFPPHASNNLTNRLLDRVLDAENNVFTGDQLNEEATSWNPKSVLVKFAVEVTNRQIPWAAWPWPKYGSIPSKGWTSSVGSNARTRFWLMVLVAISDCPRSIESLVQLWLPWGILRGPQPRKAIQWWTFHEVWEAKQSVSTIQSPFCGRSHTFPTSLRVDDETSASTPWQLSNQYDNTDLEHQKLGCSDRMQ